MTMLLTEKTKQEKIMNEVQKRRNLFGLGLTSLIAACGATDKATENEGVGIGKRPEIDLNPTQLDEETGSNSLGVYYIAPGSDGGLTERQGLSVRDVRVVVLPEERGLNESDNKGKLTFRIANGNHTQNDHATSINTFGGDEYNLIFTSSQFDDVNGGNNGKTGAVYIFWDIKDKNEADLGGATVTIFNDDNTVSEVVNVGDADITLAQKHLRVGGVTGDTIPTANPTFYKDLGGKADQADMLLQSSNGFNIIWDVTKHATTDVEGETKLILGGSPGILQVQGASYELHFIKINNNDNYDMAMRRSDNVYIVWDITNYYDAAATVATPAIDLDTAANATHGLLTIANVPQFSSIRGAAFTEIDGGGINDLIFLDNAGNTCILFGEKIANRDKYGKAISHSIDLDKINADNKFYDKDGTLQDEGFFNYDLDGDDMTPDIKNVGYRFIGRSESELGSTAKIKAAYEAAVNSDPADGVLSEEAYWDIA